MTTGKTIALTRRTLVGKVMSLLLRLSHNTCEVSGQARNSFSAAYQSQSGFLWQLSPHPLQDTGSNGTLGRVLCSFTLVLSKGHVCEHAESLQSCLILCNPMDYSPPGSPVHRDSPGKNIGVGCHALFQGIFLTQGSNLLLLGTGRQVLYLAPPGKPLIRDTLLQIPGLSVWLMGTVET